MVLPSRRVGMAAPWLGALAFSWVGLALVFFGVAVTGLGLGICRGAGGQSRERFPKQHRLYFLPLPQGQGSFRLTGAGRG